MKDDFYFTGSEGHERGSNKDFIKFLYIARGSAGEVRNMLYVGLDQNYLNLNEFETISSTASKTSSAIYGLIKYLSKNLDWKSKLTLLPFLMLLPLFRNL